MRTKAVAVSISDLRWLTKAEAMAYTHRRTEEVFDREIGSKVIKYRGGAKSFLYDKHELDRLIRTMIEIKPLPEGAI